MVWWGGIATGDPGVNWLRFTRMSRAASAIKAGSCWVPAPSPGADPSISGSKTKQEKYPGLHR